MNGMPIHVGLCLGVLLAIGTPALAALPVIEFDAPAQANGQADMTHLTWALLIFHESASARFDAHLQAESTLNHSTVDVDTERPGTVSGGFPYTVHGPPEPMQGDFLAELSFQKAWSSLYVEAESIQVHATDMEALLTLADGQTGVWEQLPERRIPASLYDNTVIPPQGLLWAIDSPNQTASIGLALQAQGVRRLEWHNATVECPSDPCLDGARDQGVIMPIPGGWVGSRIIPVREVTSSAGTINGTGTPWSVIVGGSLLTTEINGWLRLPRAQVDGQCGEVQCANPGGRTLQVQGRIVLQDLTPLHSEGRVASQFSTSSAVARIDESPTFSLTAGSAWALAAASGAAGLVLILWKPLLGFFARNTRPLLDHPNAKALHDLIHQNPGISFGGLERAAGLSHGTVQYHVKRLLDAGLVVAYGYRNSVRYFENHGRHADDWKEHAALHKPELRRLHQWLTGHPRATQAFIVRQTADWGWKRSTTQHYLKTLHGAGLVHFERTPETVEYTAQRPRTERQGPPAGAT